MRNINFRSNNILLTYYIFFVLGILITGMIAPSLNWDMIGYVAAAKNFEINSATELHSYVFENLKNFSSQYDYSQLTDSGNQYRIDMATKPELFYQQLPFYEIRPIYTLSILFLSKLGINIFVATYLISLIATALGVFITFFAIKDKLHIGLLYIFPLVLVSLGILSVASLSTPDALVFLSISVFIYVLNKEKILILLSLMPVFVLIRTDMIIFNFIVCLMVCFLYEQYRIKAIVFFVLSMIFYFSVNYFFGNYGWSTIFSFTFLDKVSNPADVVVNISSINYLYALMMGVFKGLTDYPFFAFISIMVSNLFLLKMFRKSFLINKNIMVYIFIPILYICVHFLLFPVTWNRFFMGFYMMNTIALFLLLTEWINAYKNHSTI